VGANAYQKHNFACRKCGEPIEVGMKVDYENFSTQQIPVRNCVPSNQEGSIVNLNPEFLIPDELQGRDKVFPFVEEISRIREEDPTFEADMEKTSRPAEEAIAEWEKNGRLPPGVGHDWEFAKRVWSLFLNNRHDVCVDYITRQYAHYRFDEPPHPYEVIYAICARLGRQRAKEICDALREEWEKAGTVNLEQRDVLRSYFLDNFSLGFLSSTLTVISEYMEHYSDFSQVLIYQDRGVSVGSGFNPSSVAFKDTKMIYGNAFEHLASFLVLPACLNNVVEGRPYDTFKKLTLEKYLDLDKTSRHGPFEDNPNLAMIADVLNNQIRNASHHGNMRFNPKTGYVIYRPTKGGSVKYMKYAEYLMLCNTIIQTIAGLTCFLIAELHPEEPKTAR